MKHFYLFIYRDINRGLDPFSVKADYFNFMKNQVKFGEACQNLIILNQNYSICHL